MPLEYNECFLQFLGNMILKNLQPRTKSILIVGLVIFIGISFIVSLGYFFYNEPNKPLTPPINAKDEAGRLIQLASQNFFYHELDQAVENYEKAIKLFENRSDFKRAARTYESIGDVYKFFHESKEAENAYLSAIKYYKKLNDKIGEGRAMKRMGDFYMKLSKLDKAGEWFYKAAMKVRDAKPHIVKAKIYETQGHYFLKSEQVPKALESFQQAKDVLDEIGYPLGYDNISPMIQKLKRQQKKKST